MTLPLIIVAIVAALFAVLIVVGSLAPARGPGSHRPQPPPRDVQALVAVHERSALLMRKTTEKTTSYFSPG